MGGFSTLFALLTAVLITAAPNVAEAQVATRTCTNLGTWSLRNDGALLDITVQTGDVISVQVEDFVGTVEIVEFGVISNRAQGFTITASQNGTISVNQFAGGAIVTCTRDTTPPTPTVTAPTAFTASTAFNATITFDEDVTGFAASDLIVGNGSATSVTGGPSVYTASILPSNAGDVFVQVRASSASDAVGNLNVASNTARVTAPVATTTPAVIITGPSAYTAGTDFDVTITFNEVVTGLQASEITVSGGTVSALSGSNFIYTATITPSGTSDITVSLAANQAQNAGGSGNAASNTLTVTGSSAQLVEENNDRYVENRAKQMLNNQPKLPPLLSQGTSGSFDANATNGAFNFALDLSAVTSENQSFWLQLEGSYAELGTSEGRYLFGVIGSHVKVRDGTLVGAMLQFDRLEEEDGAATNAGTGWLAGPYIVTRLPDSELIFDARLLAGRSSNDFSPFGTYTDDVDSNRVLAQFGLTGSQDFMGNTLRPAIRVARMSDRVKAYTDGAGNAIAARGIDLTEVGLGMELEMPMDISNGDLLMTTGAEAIWAETQGTGANTTNSSTSRAKIDLGFTWTTKEDTFVTGEVYLDGLGQGDFKAYGLSLRFEVEF